MMCWQCRCHYVESVNVMVASTTLYDGVGVARYQCPACAAVQDAVFPPGVRPCDGYHPVHYTEVTAR